MIAPNGLLQITAVFGNVFHYIDYDGSISPLWEIDSLGIANLAFPLSLSWSPSTTVSHIRCHKVLVPTFTGLFSQIQQQGLAPKVKTFGGCYMYRPQRASHVLSAHSWGIAIDLNPETNKMGTPGDMDAGVVKIFEDAGFTWGGNFEGDRRDPMHFQFCSGY